MRPSTASAGMQQTTVYFTGTHFQASVAQQKFTKFAEKTSKGKAPSNPNLSQTHSAITEIYISPYILYTSSFCTFKKFQYLVRALADFL